MTDDEPSLEAVRTELIRLLQADACRLAESANRSARGWSRQFSDHPTEYQRYDHILALLEAGGMPLRLVRMGDPPGSGGLASRVVDAKHRDLHIKVKIEEDRVWVLSFKASDHRRGRGDVS